MKKLVVFPALLKAHVGSYTRKDGTFVKEHDDARQAVAPKQVHSDHAFDQIKSAGGQNVRTSSGGISYTHGGKAKSLAHKDADDGNRYVDPNELQRHLAEMKPAAAPNPGEVGHHEHTTYGTYFKKGEKVKDRHGKQHEVLSHVGAEVKTAGGQSFHPTKLSRAGGAEPKLALPVKKPAAPKPTGSAAPAKHTDIGTAKYPWKVKTSEKLEAKHHDGSTHHVGGFVPPDYPENGGPTKGDVSILHDDKLFSNTGKVGKRMKTGEDSYEYSSKSDDGESRMWVTRSGHLMND